MSKKGDIKRLQATLRFLSILEPSEYELDQLGVLVINMANATTRIREEVVGRAQRAGELIPIPAMDIN